MVRRIICTSFGLLGQSINSHFFPALDLNDLRIVDNNFHGPETQISQRLLDALFYAVQVVVLHDEPSFFRPVVTSPCPIVIGS